MSIKIYNYVSYSLYLSALMKELKDAGQSYRALSQACGFKSPNYLQLVANGKRRLTEKSVRQLAVGLSLPKNEEDYLLCLARLEIEKATERKLAIMDEMRRLVLTATGARKKDLAMSSDWLHGVIYEMAGSKSEPLKVETLAHRLAGLATRDKIAKSLEFLVKKGYLVTTKRANFYNRKFLTFKRHDDVRRIDVQRNHLKYLDMAKHRLNDDINEREFQGLTIGISRKNFAILKERMRVFNDELDELLSVEQDVDTVIRIQMAAFHITRKPD